MAVATLGEVYGALVHADAASAEAVKLRFLEAGGLVYPAVAADSPDGDGEAAAAAAADSGSEDERPAGPLAPPAALRRRRRRQPAQEPPQGDDDEEEADELLLAPPAPSPWAACLARARAAAAQAADVAAGLLWTRGAPAERGHAAVTAVAWHPYLQRLAVVRRGRSVGVYDVGAGAWRPRALRAEQQRQALAAAWQPLSGTTLAVGCAGGVCLWRLLEGEDAWMTFFECTDGASPVTALAWSADGRVLAAGSPADAAVTLWEPGSGAVTRLGRTSGCGVRALRWAPSGDYLFVTTVAETTVVWEARTWTAEKWTLAAPCDAACWAFDSCALLLAVACAPGEPSAVSCLHFSRAPPDIDAETAPVDIDLELRLDAHAPVPGRVREMVWDPSGNRLAVAFAPAADPDALPPGADPALLVGLYSVRRHAYETFDLVGYIHGPHIGLADGRPQPTHLAFCSSFPRGALLSVVWGDVVSFYPLYF